MLRDQLEASVLTSFLESGLPTKGQSLPLLPLATPLQVHHANTLRGLEAPPTHTTTDHPMQNKQKTSSQIHRSDAVSVTSTLVSSRSMPIFMDSVQSDRRYSVSQE